MARLNAPPRSASRVKKKEELAQGEFPTQEILLGVERNQNITPFDLNHTPLCKRCQYHICSDFSDYFVFLARSASSRLVFASSSRIRTSEKSPRSSAARNDLAADSKRRNQSTT